MSRLWRRMRLSFPSHFSWRSSSRLRPHRWPSIRLPTQWPSSIGTTDSTQDSAENPMTVTFNHARHHTAAALILVSVHWLCVYSTTCSQRCKHNPLGTAGVTYGEPLGRDGGAIARSSVASDLLVFFLKGFRVKLWSEWGRGGRNWTESTLGWYYWRITNRGFS